METKWLEWAQRLAAIAQNGLAYTDNPFDIDRYITVRGIAAEIVAEHSGIGESDALHLFTEESGYATPKVDVRGVVFRNDALLFIRERQDGLWSLPGGWADVGISPSEAVIKEIREESGYEARAVKLLALYDRTRQGHPAHLYHMYKVFILCELTGGAASDSIETDGAGFFREDEIPPLSVGRVLPKQITRLFEHHRHPDWPTDFD